MICSLGDPSDPTAWRKCDPKLERQNEPALTVNPMNGALVGGVNDYRGTGVVLPSGASTGAWVSVLKSVNGRDFRGGLHPGCPLSSYTTGASGAPACDAQPLITGTEAADPSVACSAWGACIYSFVSFTRGANATSQLVVSQFFDDNTGQPLLQYLGSTIPDAGTSSGATGQLIDRPSLAVTAGSQGMITLPNLGTKAFGIVYVVYTMFPGTTNSQIRAVASFDGGKTFGKPVKVNPGGVVQGAVTAVDPASGTVFVAYRQMATSSQPDAIMVVSSSDQGAHWSKPVTVATLTPFDQPAGATSIRILTAPSIAVSVDANSVSRVHVAYVNRTGVLSFDGKTRDPLVMLSTARVSNLSLWTTVPVDNQPSGSDPQNTANPPGSNFRTNQFFPALNCSQGQCGVVYYDTRNDNTIGELVKRCVTAGCNTAFDFQEVRVPTGDLPTCPAKVFNGFVVDAAPAGLPAPCNTPLSRRHTGEVRASLFSPADAPSFVSGRASKLLFGSNTSNGTGTSIEQQRFVFNLPLFDTNPTTGIPQTAFHGDYIALAASQIKYNGTSWVSNLAPDPANNSPSFYAAWTSDHQVVPGACKDPAGNPIPSPGWKNQDTFVARITSGLVVDARIGSRQLDPNIIRGFPLDIQNGTNQPKGFQLTISPPVPSGMASFSTTPNFGATTQIFVNIPAKGSIARMVYATSLTPNARIMVSIVEGTPGTGPQCTNNFCPTPNGLQSTVILNGANFSTATDITVESPNLALGSSSLTTPNQSNSNITNPAISYNLQTFDVSTFDVSTFDVSTFDVSTNDYSTFDVSTIAPSTFDVSTFDVSTFDVSTFDVSTFDVSTFDVSTFDVSTQAIGDVTQQVTNTGNSGLGSAPKILFRTTDIAGCQSGGPVKCQLLINRHSVKSVVIAGKQNGTPACTVKRSLVSTVVANIPEPKITLTTDPNFLAVDPTNGDPTNAIVSVVPGEMYTATIRLVGAPICSPTNPPPCISQSSSRTVPVAQSSNGGTPVVPLVITGFSLPNGVYGGPFNTPLQSVGGGSVTWSVAGLPQGLGPSANASNGVTSIVGIPLATGTFSVTLKATGTQTGVGGKPQTDTEALNLTIIPATTTTTINSLIPEPSVVGQQVTIPVTVAPQYTGIPTGSVTVTVSDGSAAPCIVTLMNGTGSCTMTFKSTGAKKLTATYTGDNNFTSSSGTTTHQVNQSPTTTTVVSAQNPSVFGQPVTFTATVVASGGGAGTPTGTVQFAIDGSNLGAPVTLTAAGTANSGGIASLTVAGSPHTVTATYSGDANFLTSPGSLPGGQIVNKANTTTTINGVSPEPSVTGQPHTVTFAVAPVAPGAGTPTGNVTVSDGLSSCIGAAAAGSCVLVSTTAGLKTLTATYAGDSNFNSSYGNGSHTVNKASTSITIMSESPDPSILAQPVTVKYAVSVVSPGSGTPTGNVTVSDGVSSCTATVAAGQCALALTTVGSRTLTATYSGDSNFNGSVSAGVPHQVVYQFSGFFTPLGPAGTFSGSSNLGHAVPIKWTLTDFNGNVIGDLSSLSLLTTILTGAPSPAGTCSLSQIGTPFVLYSPTTGAKGGSIFRFSSPQFIFNWDTSVGVAAGCYTIVLQLSDGSPAQTTSVLLH
jgi:hypothetical protein